MSILYIDIETYSPVDIWKSGGYKYIESNGFEILMIGYAIDDSDVVVVDLANGESIPDELSSALTDSEVVKVAHNATFERIALKKIGYDVPIEQWYCTMVKCAYCGIPLSLEEASDALDIQHKKLDTGKQLIRYFSCPCTPSVSNGHRTRNLPRHNPDKWAMFKDYNKYDVLAEREIYLALDKFVIPDTERRIYAVDQQINDRGVMVDMQFVINAIEMCTIYQQNATPRLFDITGSADKLTRAELVKFLSSKTRRKIPDDSDYEYMRSRVNDKKELLELIDITESLNKTSVKKYSAIKDCVMQDHRIRGSLQFYGANRTGRWAGRLVQMQNMPKHDVEDLNHARLCVQLCDWELMEVMYGDGIDLLSQLIRTSFVPSDGRVFAVIDYSAIEARVLAWLASSEWRLNAFRNNEDIYEIAATKMFGVSLEQVRADKTLRDKAKIADLSLGYGGGLGALVNMGAVNMGFNDKEINNMVKSYRNANTDIVILWDYMIKNAKSVVINEVTSYFYEKGIVFDKVDDYLTIKLPSGRHLYYHKPIVCNNDLCYNSKTNNGTYGMTSTYGGKLTENIVQAIARDILAFALVRLTNEGYEVVSHIHDEIIIEVNKEDADKHLQKIKSIMTQPPKWAKDIDFLAVKGFISDYYKKD
jgi:DNA polymerase